MVKYPEVQEAAQAELDRVVGCDRLPNFPDEESLPYIGAVIKETLRWHNVTPLGSFGRHRLFHSSNLSQLFNIALPRMTFMRTILYPKDP